jgi:YcxB-like protein
MLSLKYVISKDDYINYYTYIMWDAPERKKKHVKYYLRQIVTNAIIIGVLFYSGIFDIREFFIYIYVGALLLIVLFQVFSARNRVKKEAEKIVEDPYNASIFLETELQLSETGVFKKDAVKETRYTWSAFMKKQENNEYYFLFLNKIDALIVPKKTFKSALDKIIFEQLLIEHLSLDAEIGHLVKS